MTPSIPAVTSRRPGPVYLAILVVVFAAAAAFGAYVDWKYWVEVQGTGLLLSLGAVVLLVVGGLIALLGHGRRRRIAFVVLAFAIGVFAGQLLGPSREPLIFQTGGKITLHVTSPIDATTTAGETTCQNVASGTEFQISGDGNTTRLGPDQAFVSIYIDKGDRWEGLRPDPRKDGVSLDIRIEGTVVTASGKPLASGLRAGPSSTLTSTMSNAGGTITFANLVAQSGPDLGGEPMDLAGTIEWTCGTTVN